ncbi:keratin, type I cytoskeletal 18 [Latimeria chalumnae]|uniref:Keratin 18 n=1 Tax=Latimeria chalumnae TaxID=7897 RepID=H3BDJ4_LATCH|nr:PREDICTED: keratin, type I cytoskeletal 18 [Latimeria chalumnae]|eukprot:XP_005986203.1 PREDICTED: keratin, type I cytoskeletal 18 [Latimeria chalumnae]
MSYRNRTRSSEIVKSFTPRYSASVSGWPGSLGMSSSRISMSQVSKVGSGYGGAGGFGGGYGGGFGGGFGGGLSSGYSTSLASSGGGSGTGIISNEKETMQDLNDRLASYLEKVRSLEQANQKLEVQIREVLDKKGPATRDWSTYEKTLEGLRKQVFDMTVDNARLVLQIDNARLAADDFRVKFEAEQAIRLSVEGDINNLRKVIDDTNMGRLHLESEIESLKEELIFIKKNHDDEVIALRQQVANSGVQVDVDAVKGPDLSAILAEIRSQYENLVQKNKDEAETWFNTQLEQHSVEITENTQALEGAKTQFTELRRQYQGLEIELGTLRSLVASLEESLRDTENRYNMQLMQLNTVIQTLEGELSHVRSDIQRQSLEYESLLNIKVKLEAEIATYRSLLDGEDFRLQDALNTESSKTVVTKKTVTTTQQMVDGKLVSESSKVTESRA